MWKTFEDVEADLLRFSEYNRPQKKPSDIPEAILNHRRIMDYNDTVVKNNEVDESLTYVVSGRGKGIKDRLIRPGEVFEHHPLDDIELKRSIRELPDELKVSGPGYSNAFIEKSIKHLKLDKDSADLKLELPSFNWTARPKTTSTSSWADEVEAELNENTTTNQE